VITAMYFALPEFRCACGFTGKRKQFVSGLCPECSQPVEYSHREYPDLAAKFVPDCQICGNYFFPWEQKDLHRYQRMVKVWIENPTGDERPLGRYVYRICQACLEESQEITKEYQPKVQQHIVMINKNSRPLFFNWLVNAPKFDGNTENIYLISIEAAVSRFMDAAIARLFGDWLEIPQAFDIELTLPDDLPVGDTIFPPENYENSVFNHLTGYTGSIFQADQNHIIIIWEG
jgi:hypothetical protein